MVRKIPFLSVFVQQAISLLVVFAMGRLCFLLVNADSFLFSDWIAVEQNAWRMDVSAIAYLSLLPILLVFLHHLFAYRWWLMIYRAYFVFVLVCVSIITAVDVWLYPEWVSKLSFRALSYLQRPEEVFQTAGWGHILLVFFTALLLFSIGLLLFKKSNSEKGDTTQQRTLSFFVFPLWVAILVIGIRGGLQQIPLQESDAYFSSNQKLNDAAVNTFWNFTASVIHAFSNRWQHPYRFFSPDELRKIPTAHLSASQRILKTERPNIVFLILEGWSADMVGANHPDLPQSCSPYFDSLAKQGIFFSQAYSSGNRSDQGISAILTSFPSLPMGAIINDPKNISTLPAISSELKKVGYTNLFLFGGQLAYGNLKALIYQKNFDTIIEEKDLNSSFYRGRLGVHDENTFAVFNQKLSQLPQPFFASLFTQSTHFHYDYPNPKNVIQWAGEHNLYANSILYSDSCLGDFFRKAKQEKWFANTLFVILPDHSHRTPRESPRYTAEFHHIPLLFYGDVIVDSLRGKRIDYPVSQCGVSATVLQQLNLDNEKFQWANNLLNESDARAFFVYTEGIGMVTPSGKISYDARNKNVVQFSVSRGDTVTYLTSAKAYLQKIYDATVSH